MQSIFSQKKHSDSYYISTQCDALSLPPFGASKVHFTSQKKNWEAQMPFYLCAICNIDNDSLRCETKERIFKGEAFPKCL